MGSPCSIGSSMQLLGLPAPHSRADLLLLLVLTGVTHVHAHTSPTTAGTYHNTISSFQKILCKSAPYACNAAGSSRWHWVMQMTCLCCCLISPCVSPALP